MLVTHVMLGIVLRQIRERRGITLEELAKRLKMRKAKVHAFEHYSGNLSLDQLNVWALVLGVPLHWIFFLAGMTPTTNDPKGFQAADLKCKAAIKRALKKDWPKWQDPDVPYKRMPFVDA